MGKTRRLLEIRELISKNKISSQEELLNMLEAKGFQSTQATLSRDLKYLRAGKISDEEKGHIYALPGNEPTYSEPDDELDDAVARGLLSIDFTGNMAVIKTLPGFASGIAYRIDRMKSFEILGTIAGDDTILIIAREGITRNDLHRALEKTIKSGGQTMKR